MKLLVIGIDGGDAHILQNMPMPTFHQLQKELVRLDITEDLWSRGWAHILCGQHGRESGAFYTKPVLGQVGKFTQSYKGSDYGQNSHLTPLWQVCEAANIRGGFMNIPTTMPAPAMPEGFLVSGAGGGFSGSGGSGIPDAVTNRPEIKAILAESRYIFDTRFRASGIREFSAFVERVNEMQKRRTAVFTQLAKQYDLQFGFVAFMALRAVQYLVLSEIYRLIENGHPQTAMHKQIQTVYQRQDEMIDTLIAELAPDKIMFVSDHGMSPYKYSMNLAPFLTQIGAAFPKTGGQGLTRTLIKQIGKYLPTSLKRNVGNKAPKEFVSSVRGPNLDWEKSKAFGSRYISGIYLNDERFTGVVKTTTEAEELTQTIIEAFNQTEVAQTHHIVASPYRALYPQAVYQNLLPDIWLERPDEIFFENKKGFLEKNPFYGPITSIAEAPQDQYTGIKGRKPLLLVDADSVAYAQTEDQDSKDLTLAYRLIKRIITN